MQWRMARRNLHSSSRVLFILRNPLSIPIHVPRTMSDRLHVDVALPTAVASRVNLRVDIRVNESREDRR